MASNWSEIPEELVYSVVERVVNVDDLIRFGAICKTWRSVKKDQVFAPLIMLAKAQNDNLPTSDDEDEGKGKGIRSFLIPHVGRRFNVELSKTQGRRCWGSPYGWIVTIGLDFNIHLLNPFTNVQLSLPPQHTLDQLSKLGIHHLPRAELIRSFTRKFVLGCNQNPNPNTNPSSELIVMAIFLYEVAFTTIVPENRIEPSSWKSVESATRSEDVIFFNGNIFIIEATGILSICDINQTPTKAIHIASVPADVIQTVRPKPIQLPIRTQKMRERFYLVEMCGHLHLITRFLETVLAHSTRTVGFLVHRFKFGENKWYYVPDLGEYALFVGNQTSFAISTVTYTDFLSSSIYFTDDRYEGYESSYCDTGVFNYEERSIEIFDFTNYGAFSKFSRPIFFMPVP